MKKSTRKKYSADFKAKVVAESNEPGAKIDTVATKHKINPAMLSTWRSAAKNGSVTPVLRKKFKTRSPELAKGVIGKLVEQEEYLSNLLTRVRKAITALRD